GVAKRSHDPIFAIFERVNPVVVAAYGELKLKDVIRLTEENLLRAISGRFESIDDDVERFTLQRGDKRLPIARHKLGATAHRLGQGVDHLLLIADITIGIGGISEDIRRPTARVGSPPQHPLLRPNTTVQPQKGTKDT